MKWLGILIALITLGYGDIPLSMLTNMDGWNALRDERLPRLIVLFCTGASLATAGAVMQSLFQNPLASPSVLGITFGGSLAFILALISGCFFWCPLAAVMGCFITLMLVYSLAKEMNQLIITGIAVSSLLIAIQSVLLYALRDQWQLIQTVSEWEAGSTWNRTWNHVHMQAPLTLVGLFGCWFYRRELDLLSLGDEEAQNLGVDVSVVRFRLFLCVALLTGGALAGVGIIAFFGLMLPHLIRQMFGAKNEVVIPQCMIYGSVTLAGLDIGLRILKIHVITIGNVSAVLGGLFFVYLLKSKKYARNPKFNG